VIYNGTILTLKEKRRLALHKIILYMQSGTPPDDDDDFKEHPDSILARLFE